MARQQTPRSQQVRNAISEIQEGLARNGCEGYGGNATEFLEEYDIKIEDDREEAGGGEFLMYVGCPEWIEGDDPISDGHYGYNWEDTLALVKFYAKHSVKHPEYATREYNIDMSR